MDPRSGTTSLRRLRPVLTVEQLWQPTPGGSGTYVVELARALSGRADVEPIGLAARHGGPPPADWPLILPVRHVPLPRRAMYDAWQRLPAARAEHTVPEADLVHATTWAVPPTRRPLVVTVHDVAFLHDTSHFTRRGNAFFRRALDHVRRRADAVVVPSLATAEDCAAAGIPSERITVVPHGTTVQEPRPGDVEDWRRAAGLERPYVLWCGTVEPRKNLVTLLAAFAAARLDGLDLVLVGPRGWGRIPDVPDSVDRDRVHVLGHLSRHDLDAAYRGARAFCFPSLREGFGLPVLEAMHHGLPVVTSAGTACAEVAGDAGLLVDPQDVEALAHALTRATGTDHDSMATASLQRSRSFSWERAAAMTTEVYRRLVGTVTPS